MALVHKTGFDGKLISQILDDLNNFTCNALKPLPFFPEISLECPTRAGSKFWKASISDAGLNLWWGRTGTAGMKKIIPASQCKNHNPILELKMRTLSKLAKGYDILPHETKLN